MNTGWIKQAGRRLGIFSVLLALWLPLAAFGQTQTLDNFLDEDGQLAVPTGFTGSLDPTGFEMQSTADGAPRFLPQGNGEVVEAVPGEWETFGGVSSGCNGDVYAMAIDASGVIYLGGRFQSCGDSRANSVAAYDPATNSYQSLGSGEQNGITGFAVYSLAVSGSDVYVGGNFFEAGGQTANNVARWDGSQWHALEIEGQNGLAGSVDALAVSADDVVVGGAGRVLRWDGSQWQSLLDDGQPIGAGVLALAISGDDIYAGLTSGVRRFDGNQWHSLEGKDGGIDSSVRALAFLGEDLYAGGTFGFETFNNIARWDGNEWHAMESGGQTGLQGHSGAPVSALAVAGGSLFVAGEFVEAGGQTANHVARWDGNEWHALESGGQNGVTGLVYPSAVALAVAGDDVFVGGDFGRAGGQVANRVARWDGDQWHALEGDGPLQNGVSVFIRAMAISGSDVYVGGRFTSAGDQLATNVARWDGSQWHSLGSGEQNGVGIEDVNAVAVSGDDVYVGGNFGRAGGQVANHIARWDGSQWHWLESGFQIGVNGPVQALAVSGDDLYVAGNFTEAGGQPAYGIARWDGSQWHPLTSNDQQKQLRGWSVNALAVLGDDLYLATGNGLQRWDGSEWHSMGGAGGLGAGAVHALAVSGDDLYAGGFFTQAGDQAANYVARWDGSQWHALGSGKQNGVNFHVNALAVSGGKVYVGGDLTEAGGQPANRVARWNGSHWAPLGSGEDNGLWRTGTTPIALAAAGPVTYVGGWFIAAGGELSNGFATFTLVDEVFRDGFHESAAGPGD